MATFDAELSRRIDAYYAAIEYVSAWPHSYYKYLCIMTLEHHLRQLLREVPA